MMILAPDSLAILGGALALAGGLAGSAIGIAKAASTGVAALAEEPGQLRNVIVLTSLPMTQTFYGLIILILVITTVTEKIGSEADGFAVFACGIIATLAFCISAIYQGAVCASGISVLSKTGGRILTNAMMLAVFVELIAVLGMVFAIMALSILGLM